MLSLALPHLPAALPEAGNTILPASDIGSHGCNDGKRYCTGAATIELKSCEASLARHWRRILDACGDAQTGALEFIETQIRHARSTKRCVGSSRPRFNLPSGRRLLKGGRVARVARAEPGLKLMLMPAPWVAQVFKEKSRPADHGVASNWIYLCSMKVFS